MEKLGEVYLATTESEQQKGWIKCGMTTRDSVQRVKEGNVASIREKYEILYRIKTPYYLELEKHMHDKFENQKEWIKVSYAEAYAEIHRFISAKENPQKKSKKLKHLFQQNHNSTMNLFYKLSLLMGLVVVLSNYLVQFPFQYFGLNEILTYGAFSLSLIHI